MSAHTGTPWFTHGRLSLLILLSCMASAIPCAAQKGKPVPEYVVKAALLVKFLKYIEWPDDANPGEAFTIVVVGRDPIDTYLDDITGKQVKGRSVVVRRIRHWEEGSVLGECHVVFISREEKKHASAILAASKGLPILTVGEFDGFVKEMNGMINMVVIDNNIRLQINQRSASEEGLRVPSSILKSAIYVNRKNTE